MTWAYMKSYLRKHCTYSFKDLEENVPYVLENQIPIAFFRRASRHCFRFMSGYRLGLEGRLLDYAVKKYSSHRKIPENVVDEVAQQYLDDVARKKKKV